MHLKQLAIEQFVRIWIGIGSMHNASLATIRAPTSSARISIDVSEITGVGDVN